MYYLQNHASEYEQHNEKETQSNDIEYWSLQTYILLRVKLDQITFSSSM